MKLYEKSALYEQISFIGYYFHWSLEEIVRLSHAEREHFCREISRINQRTSGKGRNIFEI